MAHQTLEPRVGIDVIRPLVAIVVLNWNNERDTLACLASLERLEYTQVVTIVVDNASTDHSVERIRATYPGVDVISNARNLGYAEGNNVGITRALEYGSDYVLILNNDTVVEPAALSELVTAAEVNPKAGILGPTVLCAEPEDRLFAAGGFIDWKRGIAVQRGRFQPAASYSHLVQAEIVDFVPGCALLVRRSLIESIGALSKRYFLNFEDVEWCVRAQQAGRVVLYVPKAIIWHRISATLGRASPANTYYMTRNALLFFWKIAPMPIRVLAVAHIIGRTLRTLAAWTLKPQYRTEGYRRNRAACVFAMRDFFLNRFGQMGPDVAGYCGV